MHGCVVAREVLGCERLNMGLVDGRIDDDRIVITAGLAGRKTKKQEEEKNINKRN